MKNIKRIIAAALTLVMLLSFAGCHKKNEIAVTVGDVEFTSAYYMCALMNSDNTAKSKVAQDLSDEEKNAEEIDYYSHKVDGKKFVKWVEDNAIESLKKIAAYKILCKKNKKELDKETASSVEQNAQYYWNSYGYSAYFEPNGVSYDTYLAYMTDSYYSDVYFDALYGEGGEKEVPADEVKEKIYATYIVANMLQGAYESEATDEDKAAKKSEFEGYVNEINSGKRSFRDIYIEYNKITEDQIKQVEESEDEKPNDWFASVLGSADSDNPSEYYDEVNALKIGEAKLIEMADGSGVIVAVKQDITADAYYLKSLDSSARHLLKDEDYEKFIEDYAKKLDAKINDYAVKQFKVKKIYEPETATAAQ